MSCAASLQTLTAMGWAEPASPEGALPPTELDQARSLRKLLRSSTFSFTFDLKKNEVENWFKVSLTENTLSVMFR